MLRPAGRADGPGRCGCGRKRTAGTGWRCGRPRSSWRCAPARRCRRCGHRRCRLPSWSTALVNRSVIWPSRLMWTCHQVATAPTTSTSPARPCRTATVRRSRAGIGPAETGCAPAHWPRPARPPCPAAGKAGGGSPRQRRTRRPARRAARAPQARQRADSPHPASSNKTQGRPPPRRQHARPERPPTGHSPRPWW